MERNELYPIFLKVNNLKVLIVGGGNVGLEKLTFLLKS
ncbi:MAG: NAD(P)-dependent oxidoreductase, partial [Allomuricauda sp.]